MINHCATRVAVRDGKTIVLRTCVDCGVEGECSTDRDSVFPVHRRSPLAWRPRCQACYRKWRREHSNREAIARRKRAYRQRLRKTDPTYFAFERARKLDRKGRLVLAPAATSRAYGGRLAAAPFAAWLRAYAVAWQLDSAEQIAEDLRLCSRRVRAVLFDGQEEVAFDLVDRALTNATITVDVPVFTLGGGVIRLERRPVFTIEDLYASEVKAA